MEQPSPTNFLKKITDQSSSNLRTFDPSSPDSDIFLDQETDLDGPQQDYKDYTLPVTKSIQKLKLDKRKYNNTSNELRLELIDAVETRGEKIKSAAKRLGINYSSAKAICQIYKREGRSNKKILKRKTVKQLPEAQTRDESVFLSPLPKASQGQAIPQPKDGEIYKIAYSPPTGDSLMQVRDDLFKPQLDHLKEDGYMQEPKETEITTEPLSTLEYNQDYSMNSNIPTEIKQPQNVNQMMNQNNTFVAPQFTRIQPIQTLNNQQVSGYTPNYYYIQPGPMSGPMPGQMMQPQIYSIAPNTLIPVIYTNQQSMQPQQLQGFQMHFPQNAQPMNTVPADQFQTREMNQNVDNNTSLFENNLKKNNTDSSNPNQNEFSNQNPSLVPQHSELSQPKNNFHYQQHSLMNNQMNGFQFINPTVYILPRNPNGMPAPNFPQMITNTQVFRNTYNQQTNAITTQPGIIYYGGNNMQGFPNNPQDFAKNPLNNQK